MSASARAASLPAPAMARPAAQAERQSDSLPLRLTAFFALAAFASLRYASLIAGAPAARLFAVVALASAGGAALALSSRAPLPSPVALALRALLALLVLGLALLAIGVPAHLLWPPAWHSLERDVRHGLAGLGGWLWPYRGGEQWSRLTVLLVLPLANVTSAWLCFWPSGRWLGTRRAIALGLLLAIFLTGLANAPSVGWGFQGVALVALVAAWLWLATMRAADAHRAGWWLAACSALALVAAPALTAGGPWIDYHAWDPIPATSAFQWDQLYGPLRWPRSTATMFEVSEPHRALMRVTTLDRFDGLRFLRSDSPPGSIALDLPNTAGEPSWYQRATVTVQGLSSGVLVDGGGGVITVRWLSGSPETLRRQADSTIALGQTPTSGARYEVLSYAPTPIASTLRRAPRAFPRAYLPYTQFELPGASASALSQPNLAREQRAQPQAARLISVPAPGRTPASVPALARRIETSPYAPMFALARRLAAGAPTSYDVAARIERFLLSNYRYDERVPQRRYPLEAFLFTDRRGYCQQFSGAMTLMLRMDGIPARVAAGFAPGVYDPATRRWRVQALDAHSWVEVYFSGIGWIQFDPTPPRREPSAGVAGSGIGLSPGEAPAVRHGVASSAAGAGPGARVARLSASHRGTGQAGWLLGAVAFAAMLALALAGWWVTGARRLRRTLASDGDEAVAELRRALARLGRLDRTRSRAVTLAQLQRQLCSAGASEASRYVELLAELRYRSASPRRPTPRQRRKLRRALGARGLLARARALLALPPGALLALPPRAPRLSCVSGGASTQPPQGEPQ